MSNLNEFDGKNFIYLMFNFSNLVRSINDEFNNVYIKIENIDSSQNDYPQYSQNNQSLDDITISTIQRFFNENTQQFFGNLDNKISNLEKTIDNQNQKISKLEETIDSLKNKLDTLEDYQKQIDILHHEIEELKSQNINTNTIENPVIVKKPISTSNQVVKPSENFERKDTFQEDILNDFQIIGNENKLKIANNTSKDDIDLYLKSALDISKIVDTLHSMNIDTSSYENIFNQYRKNLNHDIDKINYNDALENNELSEIVIDTINKNVSKFIISKIIDALSRKFQSKSPNSMEFKKLLRSINDYLYNLGYYTRKVIAGVSKTNKDDWDMDTFATPCNDKNLHGIIKSVETLPYYINYMNDYNKLDNLHCNGNYTVYSNQLGG